MRRLWNVHIMKFLTTRKKLCDELNLLETDGLKKYIQYYDDCNVKYLFKTQFDTMLIFLNVIA